jgi:hypothetical protein
LEVGAGFRVIKARSDSEIRALEQHGVDVAGEPELASYQPALVPHRLDLMIVWALLVAPVTSLPEFLLKFSVPEVFAAEAGPFNHVRCGGSPGFVDPAGSQSQARCEAVNDLLRRELRGHAGI